MKIEGFASASFRDITPGTFFTFNRGKLTWGMRCVTQSDKSRTFLLSLTGEFLLEDRSHDSLNVAVVDRAALTYSANDVIYSGPPETSQLKAGQLLIQGTNVYILSMFKPDMGRPVWVDCDTGELLLRNPSPELIVIVNKWQIVDTLWPHRPTLLEHEQVTTDSMIA